MDPVYDEYEEIASDKFKALIGDRTYFKICSRETGIPGFIDIGLDQGDNFGFQRNCFVPAQDFESLDAVLPEDTLINMKTLENAFKPEHEFKANETNQETFENENSQNFTVQQIHRYFGTPVEEREGRFNFLNVKLPNDKHGEPILEDEYKAPHIIRTLDIATKESLSSTYDGSKGDKKEEDLSRYIQFGSCESFTPAHYDFGGLLVWFHVKSGIKFVFLLEDTKGDDYQFIVDRENGDRDELFPEEFRGRMCLIIMKAGDTAFFGGQTIHLVYTPEDSLVYSGNVFTTTQMSHQIRAHIWGLKEKEPYVHPQFSSILLETSSRILDDVWRLLDVASQPEHLDFLSDLLTDYVEYLDGMAYGQNKQGKINEIKNRVSRIILDPKDDAGGIRRHLTGVYFDTNSPSICKVVESMKEFEFTPINQNVFPGSSSRANFPVTKDIDYSNSKASRSVNVDPRTFPRITIQVRDGQLVADSGFEIEKNGVICEVYGELLTYNQIKSRYSTVVPFPGRISNSPGKFILDSNFKTGLSIWIPQSPNPTAHLEWVISEKRFRLLVIATDAIRVGQKISLPVPRRSTLAEKSYLKARKVYFPNVIPEEVDLGQEVPGHEPMPPLARTKGIKRTKGDLTGAQAGTSGTKKNTRRRDLSSPEILSPPQNPQKRQCLYAQEITLEAILKEGAVPVVAIEDGTFSTTRLKLAEATIDVTRVPWMVDTQDSFRKWHNLLRSYLQTPNYGCAICGLYKTQIKVADYYAAPRERKNLDKHGLRVHVTKRHACAVPNCDVIKPTAEALAEHEVAQLTCPNEAHQRAMELKKKADREEQGSGK